MTNEPAAQRTQIVAFYCYGEGYGRSSAVANLSLILAAAGYRVLAADLQPATAPLRRYLAPFLPEENAGRAARPVRLTCRFSNPAGSVDFIIPDSDDGDAEPGAVRRPSARRADLTSPDYDYVLVYAPAGGAAVPIIAELSDTVVLGYAPNRRVIDKTVQHAWGIHRHERGSSIRMLPVPMMVQRDTSANMSRALTDARMRLLPLLENLPPDNFPSVEIPYEPEYFIDDILAFLEPPSGPRDRLVAAYTELAAAVTGVRLPDTAGLADPRTVSRYRTARQHALDASAAVTVLHAPADRYWAEWLAGELRDMGLTASRRRIDRDPPAEALSGSELVVISRALRDLPGGDERLAVALPPASGPERRIQLGVSVDGAVLSRDRYPGLTQISLAGSSAERAHSDLLSFYPASLTGAPARPHPRYPARDNPAVFPPAPSGTCYGREDEIDAVRDHFTSGDTPAPLAITGPPGTGKSRLALEYAHRFAGYYDLVFVIAAESTSTVRAGLRALAEKVPPAHPRGDAARGVLDHLREGRDAPERWLLIYDGAESPEALAGLLPDPGRGHVLLTSRALSSAAAREIALGALAPEPARDMLLDLVPGLLPAGAAQLADPLGRLPLAIGLAGAWLTVTPRHLARSGIDPATVIENASAELRDQLGPAGGPGESRDPVRLMVELLLRLLESDRHAPAALLLLETCAFLSSAGLSRRVFGSPGMLRRLAEAEEDLADPLVTANLRRTLVTHGFTPPGVKPEEPLRVHPRVREIVRERLDPAERDRRSLSVSRMLADSVPADIDDDIMRHSRIFAELLPHVEPSGATFQMDDAIRRWLTDQTRYLWQLETMDAWRAAAALGERLAGRWAASAPAGDEDQLLLRLRAQLANTYRSMCDFKQALKVDEDVVRKQRRVLGVDHVRTILSTRGYGADLRLTGEFEKSLTVDAACWNALSDTLGDDHPFTISVSTNMALAELMTGYPEIALERQRADADRCKRTKAAGMRPVVLFHVGTLERELGRYEESRQTLAEARDEFRDLVTAGRQSPTAWAVLRTDAGLAITERRLGRPDIDATRSALNTCMDTYGSLYPDVLALELSLAGDLYALGERAGAVEQAQAARAGYVRVFGDAHPFTRICEVNLCGYALADGRLDQARELSETVLAALGTDLMPGHLWLQAAKVARANVLAADGRPDEALRVEEEVYAEYRRQLGPAGPLTAAVAANIGDTRRRIAGSAMDHRNIVELDTPPY